MADSTRPASDYRNQPADQRLINRRPELLDPSLRGLVPGPQPELPPQAAPQAVQATQKPPGGGGTPPVKPVLSEPVVGTKGRPSGPERLQTARELPKAVAGVRQAVGAVKALPPEQAPTRPPQSAPSPRPAQAQAAQPGAAVKPGAVAPPAARARRPTEK